MEQTMNSYEAMFLLDAGQGPEQASEPIRRVLERNGADILTIKPWEERRLAYEIAGRKRGLYMLSYFKLDPTKVSELEHDAQLVDEILRVLVLRKDDLTDEEVNAETPAMTGPTGDGADGEDNDDQTDRRRNKDDSDSGDSDDSDDSDDDGDQDADESDDKSDDSEDKSDSDDDDEKAND